MLKPSFFPGCKCEGKNNNPMTYGYLMKMFVFFLVFFISTNIHNTYVPYMSFLQSIDSTLLLKNCR